MKNRFEGCINFALLSSATAVSCLVILNTAIKLVSSPDTLSSGEIGSAASGVILLGMIIITLRDPHK